jgi:hypothetical protein
MNLTIANISSSIKQTDFEGVVKAIQTQIDNDFSPEWGGPHKLQSTSLDIANSPAPVDGETQAIIYVGESSSDPTTGIEQCLGYHFENHHDIPYGFIYLDVIQMYKQTWTVTLSHEALELLADPSADSYVPGPDPSGSNDLVQYCREVCDPVQGDTYLVEGVAVSNFVTKKWFDLANTSAFTNFTKLDLDPLTARPTGYFQYYKDNTLEEKDGPEFSAMRNAGIDQGRKKMSDGRRNNRRARAMK